MLDEIAKKKNSNQFSLSDGSFDIESMFQSLEKAKFEELDLSKSLSRDSIICETSSPRKTGTAGADKSLDVYDLQIDSVVGRSIVDTSRETEII